MPLLYNFDVDTSSELLSEPLYDTMEELDTINKNKKRKRGRNEMGK